VLKALSGNSQNKVPKIICSKLKPTNKRATLFERLAFICTAITLFLIAIELPYGAIYKEYGIVAIILFLVATYLVFGEDSYPLRSFLASRGSRLFWYQFLQLDHARTEMLKLYYDGKFQKFSTKLAMDSYVSFPNCNVSIQLREDPDPNHLLTTDLSRVRKLVKHRLSWNSVIYRLASLTNDKNDLLLVFEPGCYYDYIDTCEDIGHETNHVLRKKFVLLFRRRLGFISEANLEHSYKKLFSKMPRRTVLAQTKDSILEPADKCLKMGINNVTLLRDVESGKYRFLIARRSSKLVEYPDTFHVVPAGAFEPSKNERFYDPMESIPLNNVLRETFEECFIGDKKGTYDKDPYPLSQVFRHKQISDIRACLDTNEAEFKILGVYFDYFNAKVEMTSCLIIHDPNFLKERMAARDYVTNWEYVSKLEMPEFTNSEIEKWANRDDLLPIGAVALRDAAKVFSQLLT
jgi:hypothetical protein